MAKKKQAARKAEKARKPDSVEAGGPEGVIEGAAGAVGTLTEPELPTPEEYEADMAEVDAQRERAVSAARRERLEAGSVEVTSGLLADGLDAHRARRREELAEDEQARERELVARHVGS